MRKAPVLSVVDHLIYVFDVFLRTLVNNEIITIYFKDANNGTNVLYSVSFHANGCVEKNCT